MASPITLPPFEEQVLHLLGALTADFEDEGVHGAVCSDDLKLYGARELGDEWAGAPVYRPGVNTLITTYLPTYPKIDTALGRLAKKGMVEREAWSYIQEQGYTAGRWILTETGRVLMGLSPQSPYPNDEDW